MEISAIAGSAPVLPVTPTPTLRVPVENESTERVADIESGESARGASASPAATQAAAQPYGVYAPAPLNDFQGTKVDIFA